MSIFLVAYSPIHQDKTDNEQELPLLRRDRRCVAREWSRASALFIPWKRSKVEPNGNERSIRQTNQVKESRECLSLMRVRIRNYYLFNVMPNRYSHMPPLRKNTIYFRHDLPPEKSPLEGPAMLFNFGKVQDGLFSINRAREKRWRSWYRSFGLIEGRKKNWIPKTPVKLARVLNARLSWWAMQARNYAHSIKTNSHIL